MDMREEEEEEEKPVQLARSEATMVFQQEDQAAWLGIVGHSMSKHPTTPSKSKPSFPALLPFQRRPFRQQQPSPRKAWLRPLCPVG